MIVDGPRLDLSEFSQNQLSLSVGEIVHHKVGARFEMCEDRAHAEVTESRDRMRTGCRCDPSVKGLFSAKVPNSSFAEVHMGLQPTRKMKMMIRRMKRKMRETVKSAEWRVEEYQDNNTLRMIHG